MKKLKLLLLLLLNVLLLVCVPKSTNSCGFSIYKEEYRFWTFDPNMGGEPGLQALFYSLDYSHKGFNPYDYWEDEIPVYGDEFESNIQLWWNYCKSLDPNAIVNKKDIILVLYETNPIDYFQIKEGLFQQNSFMKLLMKFPSVLKYLDYAKKSEYQSNERETWTCSDCPEIVSPGNIVPAEKKYSYQDYGVSPDPINGINNIEEGKVLLKKCSDPFLQQRYAYQIVRMSYYNLDSVSLSNYYQKYLEKLPETNWLRNNAMMYEVLFHTGAEQNIGLTRIFDICPDKRYRCEELFKNALFEPTLKLARGNHEKAMVHVMHALQQPMEQLNTLKTINLLEPDNKFLPFLWVREINKLEDWVLGPAYNGFGSTKSEAYQSYEELSEQVIQRQMLYDKKYALEVLAYLKSALPQCPKDKLSFYHFCAGYISFMLKDLTQAEEFYSKVNINDLGEIGKTQWMLNQYMLHLSQTELITKKLEEDLAACLYQLQSGEQVHPQYKQMSHQLINFSAAEFRRRGSAAKGLMLYGKSAQPYAYHPLIGLGNVYTQIYTYAKPNEIDEMIYVLHKADPNTLEKFLRGNVYTYTYDYGENIAAWDENKLLDLKSMKLVQQDKLLEAYQTVQKIDTSYWNNEVNSMFKKDDPFCLNPWNGHDPMNYKKVSYNKKTFLQELLRLKFMVTKVNGEEKAKLLLKIANAYYSMSYWGKFWIMQKNFQGGWEPEQEYTDVDPSYYSGVRAKYYYKLLLQTSHDPQLLGASVYILNTAFQNTESNLNKNRALIKSNRIATDYYEQLSANCDLFYEFVRRYN